MTVALGTAKKSSQETYKARRQRQAQEKKDKQAEADAKAEDDTHDGEGEGSEAPNTPETELPTATRTVMTIHRPASSSQVATRAQRRGTASVLTIAVKRQRQAGSSEPCDTPTTSESGSVTCHTMALVAAGMARLRAVLKGVTVRHSAASKLMHSRQEAATEKHATVEIAHSTSYG